MPPLKRSRSTRSPALKLSTGLDDRPGEREDVRERDVFAERHELHLLVGAGDAAVGTQQERRVEPAILRRWASGRRST